MKQHAPAVTRNRDAILQVLDRYLPVRASVLEIASGSGEHAAYFSRLRPEWRWQPSDPNPACRESIEAYRRELSAGNLGAPLELDASGRWSHDRVDAVVCINMIHISPWKATVGLFEGASRCLVPGGVLVTYGPYRFSGRFTAESNQRFDASLRSRDPSWGVRDEAEITERAEHCALEKIACEALPANNHALVYRRSLVSKGVPAAGLPD